MDPATTIQVDLNNIINALNDDTKSQSVKGGL